MAADCLHGKKLDCTEERAGEDDKKEAENLK